MLHNQLKRVEYSTRFALGMFFSKDANIRLKDGCCLQYIANDPVVRFVSIDNLKRGKENCCPSVVVHTSVPFGKANIDKTKEEMFPFLVESVRKRFPDWPEPQIVKSHKWLYSQVSSAFEGLPGAVNIGDGLIAAGDGFTHSNFDGCIESAKAAADAVLRHLSKSP